MAVERTVAQRGTRCPYCVCATRVQTGGSPFDLFLFFRRHRAALEQICDKIGDGSSLGLQQMKQKVSESQTQTQKCKPWAHAPSGSTNCQWYDLSVILSS